MTEAEKLRSGLLEVQRMIKTALDCIEFEGVTTWRWNDLEALVENILDGGEHSGEATCQNE